MKVREMTPVLLDATVVEFLLRGILEDEVYRSALIISKSTEVMEFMEESQKQLKQKYTFDQLMEIRAHVLTMLSLGLELGRRLP